MRFFQFAGIFGCTTAAFISIAPIQVDAATFKVISGVTSIDRDHEEILSSIGLTLTGTNQTVAPIPSNYLVGFNIDSLTNFTFSDEGGFTPLSGTIKQTGTVTFNKEITVGDFSIGFAPGRTVTGASGLVLRDTFSLNTILFDLSTPGLMAFDGQNLTIPDVQLLISPEFADVLDHPELSGLFAGTARIDAQVAAVPEPDSVLATLVAGAALLAGRFYTQKIKYT
ncbi:hypothetical protein [Nostoc sp. 'Lobaria pulmonaria (5183) cyanobiont']|uniref:hypothetical protein n=1 Tax=Nostoc sp. 'Lobaria pulmonaria (5183) cyanobiont' TaxID=1618022 RepID=UPI000CF31056|nr:hypothetical protein [Nostoc sp. 'Lobaria pulmonaria (5183) cyanobiont']AVH72571.1 hypothetical protein NLP_4098 [Nostoc sp. 'Lobaria pulmonaria (5183) cyanobiont']